jgi:hypothetical protein
VFGHEIACGRQREKFASPWNRFFEEDTKCHFVILSEAKDLAFLRFFGRFASSE